MFGPALSFKEPAESICMKSNRNRRGSKSRSSSRTSDRKREPKPGERKSSKGAERNAGERKSAEPGARKSDRRPSRGGGRDPRPRHDQPRGARPDRTRSRLPDDGRHRVTGPRFVREAIRGGTIHTLNVERRFERNLADLIAEARAAGLRVNLCDSLDPIAGELRHQGVLGEGEAFPFVDVSTFEALDAPLLLALDQVTDPHNFGAILRSALVFGVDGVIVPKHGSARVTPVVVRSSAGASERIPIAEVTNLQRTLDDLADQGREVVGLAGDGEHSIDNLDRVAQGRVLVAGSEGSGLRRLVRDRCTYCVRIPQVGDFDSLNVSVATAIVLYEASRAR